MSFFKHPFIVPTFMLFSIGGFAQNIVPTKDFNNYFVNFQEGFFRPIEIQPILSYKAGDEVVAYIDTRGNMRLYDGIERKDVTALNVDYQVSDHLVGYKIANGLRIIKSMTYPSDANESVDAAIVAEIHADIQGCYDGMNDDLNTAVTIASLFSLLKKINQLYTGQLSFEQLGQAGFDALKSNYISFMEDVLGLLEEFPENQDQLIKGMLQLYQDFKANRQYDKVDEIRASFKSMGLLIKDMKTRIDWGYEE